jgi:hypothetical protein
MRLYIVLKPQIDMLLWYWNNQLYFEFVANPNVNDDIWFRASGTPLCPYLQNSLWYWNNQLYFEFVVHLNVDDDIWFRASGTRLCPYLQNSVGVLNAPSPTDLINIIIDRWHVQFPSRFLLSSHNEHGFFSSLLTLGLGAPSLFFTSFNLCTYIILPPYISYMHYFHIQVL